MFTTLSSTLFGGKYAGPVYAPALPVASAEPRPSDFVITFDDINVPFSQEIEDGYRGLSWDNMFVISRDFAESVLGTNSGFTNGIVSDPNVAFTDGNGSPATLTSGGANSTLRSIYLTAGVRDGMTVEVRAFDDGVQKYAQTLTLNDDNETLFAFNFKNIDTVTFVPSGGTPTNPDDDGFYVVIDNMQISAAAGSVSGNVFADRNGNGVRNARDVGLFDQFVYVDLNANGIYDRGEARARTAEDGSYLITNVPFGTWDVRVSLSARYTATSPVRVTDDYTVAANRYNWVDIEQGTNRVTFSSLDDGFATFNVSQPISFYGEEYSAFSISTNGVISFNGSFESSFGNTALPSPKADALIAPMWNDFDLRDGGSVYAFDDVANERVIVTWDDVRYYTDGSAADPNASSFQAIIGYDGTIVFNYSSVAPVIADVGDFTIGVEDETGTAAATVASGSNVPANGSSFVLTPTLDIDVGVASVVVNSGRETGRVDFGVARVAAAGAVEAPMGLEFLALA